MIYDAVVVGGGMAGLAAAVSVAGEGGSVCVLEQAPRAGGRCYSYRDPATGDVVDNGQHVLLGAYAGLLKYLRMIGTADLLSVQSSLELPFHHPERGRSVFRLSRLPSPIHLTAGILRYGLLSPRERRDLLRAGLAIRTGGVKKIRGLTVSGWLAKLGQSENARRCFWDPISVSVMNELPELSSASLFAGSMRRAFLGRGADSRMLIPAVGQSELYVDGARRFLEERRSALRVRARVSSVLVRGDAAEGVIMRDGSAVRGKAVILAVPHFALPGLLPVRLRGAGTYDGLGGLRSSPIVSVNLWFDRDFMDDELLGLIGRTVQWLFNRRRIVQEEGGTPGYLSAVISAAHRIVDLPARDIVGTVMEDVRAVFPAARRAALTRSVVVKEKRATFSPTPESDSLRPGPETAVRDLYLAGDWTDTGLPATIEGAVQSGFTAARLVLR